MTDNIFPGVPSGSDLNGGFVQPGVPYGAQPAWPAQPVQPAPQPMGAPDGYQILPGQGAGYGQGQASYGQVPYGQAPYGPAYGQTPYGAGGYPPGSAPTPPRNRGPMIAIIAVVVVVVLAVIGLAVHFLGPAAKSSPTPAPTSSAPTMPAPTATHSTTKPPINPPTSTSTTDLQTSAYCVSYELFALEMMLFPDVVQSEIESGNVAEAQQTASDLLQMAQLVQQSAPANIRSTADSLVTSVTKVNSSIKAGQAPAQSDMDALASISAQLDSLSTPICGQ